MGFDCKLGIWVIEALFGVILKICTLIGCFQFGQDWIEIGDFGRFQDARRDRPLLPCRGTIVSLCVLWVFGGSSRQGFIARRDMILQRVPHRDEELLGCRV